MIKKYENSDYLYQQIKDEVDKMSYAEMKHFIINVRLKEHEQYFKKQKIEFLDYDNEFSDDIDENETDDIDYEEVCIQNIARKHFSNISTMEIDDEVFSDDIDENDTEESDD